MITPRENGAEETLELTWTAAGHLDDGTIEAWLDVAFDTAQMAEVAAHVHGCATCQARVAHARGFIAAASRVVRALDAVPLGVVSHEDTVRAASRIIAAADATRSASAVPRARAHRAWYTQPFVRAAAALVVTVAGGSLVMSRTGSIAVTPAVEVKADHDSVAASMVSESAPRVDATQPTVMPADKRVAVNSAPLVAGDAFRQTERLRVDEEQRRSAPVAAKADAAGAAPSVALPSPVAAPVAAVPAPATIAPMKSAAAGSAVTAQLERREISRENAIEADRLKSRALGLDAVTFAGRRATDEPVPTPSRCWTVLGAPLGSTLRLPTELRLPDIDGARMYPVQWMGWPDSNTSLPVRMRVDSVGRLTGESTSEGQRLQLIVQRVAGGWQGTATHTIEGKRTIHEVQLKSVSDALCNP